MERQSDGTPARHHAQFLMQSWRTKQLRLYGALYLISITKRMKVRRVFEKYKKGIVIITNYLYGQLLL